MLSFLNCKFTNLTKMSPLKKPTPLQLFKQWQKYELASDKARDEKKLLSDMAAKALDVQGTRITVDGFIYELTTSDRSIWYSDLKVVKLGSVEEFSKLVK